MKEAAVLNGPSPLSLFEPRINNYLLLSSTRKLTKRSPIQRLTDDKPLSSLLLVVLLSVSYTRIS